MANNGQQRKALLLEIAHRAIGATSKDKLTWRRTTEVPLTYVAHPTADTGLAVRRIVPVLPHGAAVRRGEEGRPPAYLTHYTVTLLQGQEEVGSLSSADLGLGTTEAGVLQELFEEAQGAAMDLQETGERVLNAL